MTNANVGFLTKKKPFTSGETPKATTSDAQKAKDTALRAKQDAQSAKEQAGNSARVQKQISNAKAERSPFGTPSYANPSAPATKASSRDPFTGKVKPMRSSSEYKKSEPAKAAPAKPAASGDFSAAEIAAGKARREKNAAAVAANPKAYAPKPAAKAAPAKKPAAKPAAPSAEDTARQARIDENAKFFKPRIAAEKAAKGPGMKCGGKAYAKGGSVTRADGCATKGHTKGRMR